jgi:hypothetical protein
VIKDDPSPGVSAFAALLLLENVLHPLAKRFEALETDGGREVIVDFRQHLAFEAFHGNRVGNRLPGLVFVLKIVGKHLRRRADITDPGSLEGFIDLWRRRIRTNDKARPLFVVRLVVTIFELTLQVNLHQHPIGDLIVLGGLPCPLLFLNFGQLVVNFGLADLERYLRQ